MTFFRNSCNNIRKRLRTRRTAGSWSVSEIVVPVFGLDGQVLGVIDIDSPVPGRFDEADAKGLGETAEIIASFMY